MEKIKLDAQQRTDLGTGPSRRARKAGFVPATLYGHGMKPLSLQVGSREFNHVLHTGAGENVVVDLKVEGVKLKESTCLIRDIQHHPVSDDVLHVDFTVISMNEKIEVEVHLATVNVEESLGIKEGGVLDVVHHEIEVVCLPTNIPEKIEVDVKELNIGDSIHVKDVTFPEGVECTLDAEEVLVAVHAPTVEEEAPAEEGEEGAAEPEVIEKGKKEEDAPAEGGGEAKKEGAKKEG